MRTLSTLTLFICISLIVYGTAQYPNKIIYNGKEYKLYSNPLENYFEKYPYHRPQKIVIPNELLRGYVATFEIRDNQLYLNDIEIPVSKKFKKGSYVYQWESVLYKDDSIKVDWMTGFLVLPKGQIIYNNEQIGYGAIFDYYILLEFDRGNFVKEKTLGYEEYEKFKEKQFQAFKETEEYEKIKKDLKKGNENYNDEFIDAFLRNFEIEYTSKMVVSDTYVSMKAEQDKNENLEINSFENYIQPRANWDEEEWHNFYNIVQKYEMVYV